MKSDCVEGATVETKVNELAGVGLLFVFEDMHLAVEVTRLVTASVSIYYFLMKA